MQIGLLWFDDDPRKTLEAKIQQAAARYHEKFGNAANTCYVNPAVATAHSIPGDNDSGLRELPARSVRPNYFWLGVDDNER